MPATCDHIVYRMHLLQDISICTILFGDHTISSWHHIHNREGKSPIIVIHHTGQHTSFTHLLLLGRVAEAYYGTKVKVKVGLQVRVKVKVGGLALV